MGRRVEGRRGGVGAGVCMHGVGARCDGAWRRESGQCMRACVRACAALRALTWPMPARAAALFRMTGPSWQ